MVWSGAVRMVTADDAVRLASLARLRGSLLAPVRNELSGDTRSVREEHHLRGENGVRQFACNDSVQKVNIIGVLEGSPRLRNIVQYAPPRIIDSLILAKRHVEVAAVSQVSECTIQCD